MPPTSSPSPSMDPKSSLAGIVAAPGFGPILGLPPPSAPPP
eukprot:CAMPEP_0196724368 /NCGR_PEP_ID=MMETSP1091-20130531/6246_1 /TAXON_ID=302021 /ORGANISM="Rhodomonas sp., Strain CCMP768" /LENGTH=40 /DNA_ID= /DNA_START= /DNA_END= /DNA_ORIENTATION=